MTVSILIIKRDVLSMILLFLWNIHQNGKKKSLYTTAQSQLYKVVYVTDWYPTFCLTFHLTCVYLRGELQQVGDVGKQKIKCGPIRTREKTDIGLLDELYDTKHVEDVFKTSWKTWYCYISLWKKHTTVLWSYYSEVNHFADTNPLNFNSCVKSINKQVNYELKKLSNWLKANKISLNVGKTELVLFTSSKKQLDIWFENQSEWWKALWNRFSRISENSNWRKINMEATG